MCTMNVPAELDVARTVALLANFFVTSKSERGWHGKQELQTYLLTTHLQDQGFRDLFSQLLSICRDHHCNHDTGRVMGPSTEGRVQGYNDGLVRGSSYCCDQTLFPATVVEPFAYCTLCRSLQLGMQRGADNQDGFQAWMMPELESLPSDGSR